ncbi:thymidylate synthase [archaeon]|nr:thymidylate synthase [archaeon]
MVEQYLDHSREILTSEFSVFKWGSKGAGIISITGHHDEYDLRKGFPLLTTKKMFTRGIAEELIWFFKGNTNIKPLEDKNVTIWTPNVFQFYLSEMIRENIFPKSVGTNEAKYSDEWESAMSEFGTRIRKDSEFAQKWGNAGPIYPEQWRAWKYYDEETGQVVKIDQLGQTIEKMRKKPYGKKYLVSSWQPGALSKMSLPPCHVLYHLIINPPGEEGEKPTLDLLLYQRSSDMFLGVPFNIASYAMLTQIIAQELNLEPRRFIHNFGDSHFYTGLEKRSQWYGDNFLGLREKIRAVNDREGYLEVIDWINKNAPSDRIEQDYDHVTAILKQLSREPKPLPKLVIASGKNLDDLTVDDFSVIGYSHDSLIKRKMHV